MFTPWVNNIASPGTCQALFLPSHPVSRVTEQVGSIPPQRRSDEGVVLAEDPLGDDGAQGLEAKPKRCGVQLLA